MFHDINKLDSQSTSNDFNQRHIYQITHNTSGYSGTVCLFIEYDTIDNNKFLNTGALL